MLMSWFIMRVIRTEGFAYAVVDREQESKRCYGCNAWHQ